MSNAVAWFDITSPDAARLQAFYRDMFGWKIDTDNESSYGMVAAGEGGIGGGIGQGDGPGIVMYITVDDAQGHLDKIEKAGGATVVKPYEIPGVGSLAVFTDPDGNRVGLWQR